MIAPKPVINFEKSLWDLAIEQYGSIEGVFLVATDNGFGSLGDEVVSSSPTPAREGVSFKPVFNDSSLAEEPYPSYTCRVEPGQCVWDLSIEQYGSIEQVFALISDNALRGFELNPEPGLELQIQRNIEGADYTLLNYFRGKIRVNTGESPWAKERGGIGYMKIDGKNFKVS